MKQCCKDTFAKIPDDEPAFILRAQDLTAPVLVRAWIDNAIAGGVNADKLERAEQHYADMIEFQKANPDRCKFPD